MPDVIEDTEFTCPKCGSHEFGSAQVSQVPFRLERICHGYTDKGACGFRFMDTDDAKYFRGLGTFRPRTAMGRSR